MPSIIYDHMNLDIISLIVRIKKELAMNKCSVNLRSCTHMIIKFSVLVFLFKMKNTLKQTRPRHVKMKQKYFRLEVVKRIGI